MLRTDRFAERIGAVFLPEAGVVDVDDEPAPGQAGAVPDPVGPLPTPGPLPPFQLCRTTLRQGCYTLQFTPAGTPLWGTRFRGTLRVEHVPTGIRLSGDLYAYRLFDDIVIGGGAVAPVEVLRAASVADEATDTGGTIPVYRRRSYQSYLKGTGARLISIVPQGATCSFSLDVDEFVYNHPATGFSGSFATTANRSIRYVLRKTATPDLYSGEALVGGTTIGTVSMRWVSPSYRRADLRIFTLDGGAVTPPADIGGSSIASIFADVGWQLTVTDEGQVPLPASLSGIDIFGTWSTMTAQLHTLMSSVPGYDPAVLDSVWRVHLVSVPAQLGQSRGVMFDSSFGADPNAVPREGSATFSHDGYPLAETVQYDAAADKRQFEVPRAFLRSATHEVGHAFNQIHQNFEAGIDNSIMTPTNAVANVIGAGTFPDQINLAFNDTVKGHLRHLPDPAVRPGAMEFFGSAVAAPQPADVAWLETAGLEVELSTTSPRLGEPVQLTYTLSNAGDVPLPVPETLDTESMAVRINVTDPAGRITFMRPDTVSSCPSTRTEALAPGSSVGGTVTLYWGRDGFAFESPGRHTVEVIAMWDVGGVLAGTAAQRQVFVTYPTSDSDNEVAAMMLDPNVGTAVQAGDLTAFGDAQDRVARATSADGSHPAIRALGRLGLVEQPSAPRGRGRGKKST